jgi:hypothetical protein
MTEMGQARRFSETKDMSALRLITAECCTAVPGTPGQDIAAGSKCPENWCRLEGSSAQGRAIVSAEISQRKRGPFAVRILEPMGVRASGSV